MNIAILGGGVAGVSTAIALKIKGFNVTVYERHRAETNMGGGIVVWPNAAYVLEKLGVLNQIRAVSGCPTRMQRLTHKGENLGSINIESINKIMGYSSFSILRADFQNILISKLNELGISIQYNHEVTQLQVKNNQTQIEFQNGTKISADIIIGADGRMSSVARKYILGENTPVYQGFINWVGVFESEKEVFRNIVVNDYWGIGERFGIVPISPKKAYWAGGIASVEVGDRESSRYKQELHTIFSNWPVFVSKMISETPTSRINKIYVHDHNPVKIWHKNNVIIIGDAAHAPLPTSGQGACQALEDAWHIANCLENSNNNIDHAFTQFTQLRSEKTANIIMAGRGLASSLFNTNSQFCKVRNENSKNTDYSRMAVGMAQAWSQNLINVYQGHLGGPQNRRKNEDFRQV